MRTGRSFSRPSARFEQLPTVLVLCEDLKSSKKYLEDLAKHFRANIKVKFVHCGKTDPLGIVNEAKTQRKSYEQIYCVIDRDSHDNFDQALDVARGAGIKTIVSYPCFEYWLILHFGYNRKPYRSAGVKSAGDQVMSDLKKIPMMENYLKGTNDNLFKSLGIQRYSDAKTISARILAEAKDLGEHNPSTQIHELGLVIEKLSAPQPIEAVV